MNVWHLRTVAAANERNGVWVTWPATGWRFRVARLCDWNKAYAEALVRIAQEPETAAYIERAREKDYKRTAADDAIDARLQLRAFGEGCVLDWERVIGPDGDAFSHTPAHVFQLLEHFADLAAFLRKFAADEKNFARYTEGEQRELALGNSPGVSNTSRLNGIHF